MAEPQQIFLPSRESRQSVFTMARDINEISGFSQVERGSETITLPNWARCGIEISERCGCYPTVYQSRKTCVADDGYIAPNWPDDLPPEILLDEFGGSTPRQPKIAEALPCPKKFVFQPLTLIQPLDGQYPCTSVESLAREAELILTNNSHHDVARLLIESTNGNPGLAVAASSVTPVGVKQSACTVLEFMHANARNGQVLVVPRRAMGTLSSEGLIFREGDQWFDIFGAAVVTDSGFDGFTGPPETPWDCASPIDPAADLQTHEDPNCAWIYLVEDLWVGRTEALTPALNARRSEGQIKGNIAEIVAEMQVIAAFNPCSVEAGLIDTSKKVGC